MGYIQIYFSPSPFSSLLACLFLAALSGKMQPPIQFIGQQLRNLQLRGSCRITTDHLQQLQKTGFSTNVYSFVQLNRYYHPLATADKLKSSSTTPSGINPTKLLRVPQDSHRYEELCAAAILLRFPSLWTRCWSAHHTSDKNTFLPFLRKSCLAKQKPRVPEVVKPELFPSAEITRCKEFIWSGQVAFLK